MSRDAVDLGRRAVWLGLERWCGRCTGTGTKNLLYKESMGQGGADKIHSRWEFI